MAFESQSTQREVLYTLAPQRGVEHRSFSASRENAKAQFHQWLSQERNRPAASGQAVGPSGSAFPESAIQAASGETPAPDLPQREENSDALVPQWFTSTESLAADPARGGLAQAAGRSVAGWHLLNQMAGPPGGFAHSAQEGPGRLAGSLLIIFSIAGGVGKTAALAALGRVLAAREERVLLADTVPMSLVPCYFGGPFALEPAPSRAASGNSGNPNSALRRFSPPSGSGDTPIEFLSLYGAGEKSDPFLDRDAADPLLQELQRCGSQAGRILIDLPSAALATVRRFLPADPLVLVPLLPDINSVASVAEVEQTLGAHAATGKLFYLLNQFDPASSLHVDVREVLTQRLGTKLLPFAVRRSPEVGEALAQGMTVLDYAPQSGAAEDFARLADWLQTAAPVSAEGLERVRWSER
jgi:cellulose synthase operon protein YhjQ